MGYYGSTSFLWRHIFDKVITIEKSHDRTRSFGTNMYNFYGKWVLNDKKSSFIIGMSNETASVRKAYELTMNNPIDVLFIDGDHSYEGVLTDWLLYNPLVRKGGIVAFHDVLPTKQQIGVPRFLELLFEGKIDGKPREKHMIVKSKKQE